MTIGLVLEPLDTAFFRGGRPFGAGLPGESSLPGPQTLAGALRTLLLHREGADFRALRGTRTLAEGFRAAGAPWLAEVSFRGPWPAEQREGKLFPLTPAPANIRIKETNNGLLVSLYRPLRRALPGWRPPLETLCPLWPKDGVRFKERPQWLTFEGLAAWLHDEPMHQEHFRKSADLFGLEERTGIAIEPTKWTAAEGMIYTARHLRLKPGLVFYAEADLPGDKVAHFAEPQLCAWGGEGRRAIVRKVEAVCWPRVEAGERASLLLLTPAFFHHGWRPGRLDPSCLRAAAVAGPYATSGWDLARGGPKPTRFGVGPGSVYFIEGPSPGGSTLAEDAEDAALGYGFFVKGTWNYALE